MSKSDIAVSVRGLSKSYTIAHEQEKHVTLAEAMLARLKNPLRRPKTETFWALQDINFDIKKGDVVGIIGRNGAGKSTLLKILSRITEPTTGQIDLYGRVGSLLEVGTGFHPELTGRENIFLNGAILGMSRAEIKKQFDAIVDFAGVETFLDTPVKRYSSGMYVRLAFAVAAHLRTEILIVDEVLAVGDAEFQKRCLGKMKDVSSTGRTVLFVSHNMGAITTLCKGSIVLNRGEIAYSGACSAGIDMYLQISQSGELTRQWDVDSAPGNAAVRLRSVRVCQPGRVSNTFLPIDREIEILINIDVLVAGPRLHGAIELRDVFGTYILATNARPSANSLDAPWYGVPMEAGSYELSCTIPPNFLNDTRYEVDVAIENYRSEREILVPSALSFTVEDTGDMRGDYTGPWIGLVRPKLAWNVRTCAQAECV